MKQVLVVAASLVVFVVPNVAGLAVWILGGGLPPVLRSLTAILGWVISFGFSAQVFWRIILDLFPVVTV